MPLAREIMASGAKASVAGVYNRPGLRRGTKDKDTAALSLLGLIIQERRGQGGRQTCPPSSVS